MENPALQEKIRKIPGVLGVNISMVEGELSEVHIVADMSRKPKEIMLDAKSVLCVELQKMIDFRIISVAQVAADEPACALENHFSPTPMISSRIAIIAAYLKRMSNNSAECVVELNAKGKTYIGTAVSTQDPVNIPVAVCRAFSTAVKQLLRGYIFVPQIELTSKYCVAEVKLINSSDHEAEEFVGAVRLSGDIPWDCCRAILQAVNRKMELILRQTS